MRAREADNTRITANRIRSRIPESLAEARRALPAGIGLATTVQRLHPDSLHVQLTGVATEFLPLDSTAQGPVPTPLSNTGSEPVRNFAGNLLSHQTRR